MRLKDLINLLGDFKVPEDFEVRGISCNSKEVSEKFIFVAIKGNKEDGNKFIEEAIDRGAKVVVYSSNHQVVGGQAKFPPSRQAGMVHSENKAVFIAVKDARKALAILAAKFYKEPSAKVKVIGVTGTNGKTTVTYLIEALLKGSGYPVAVIGTVNYRIKDKIIPSKNTTPGPVELESMLADMAQGGVKYCAMEVSSHALDQDRIAGINFCSAIFTNLTQDHLDYHGNLRNYFNCKAKLFKDIKSDSVVIINSDDRFGIKLKKITKARVVTYGIKNKSDVSAKEIEFGVLNTKFRLVCPKGDIIITSPLIGKYNVYNVLAACVFAQEEGLGLSEIKSGIEGFSFVPGRLERIDSTRGFSIFVDYAHTEDALKNVINSLRQISAARIIVVFGCGGERDKIKRPKMGGIVTELSDFAIITNDNPRSEDPVEIIKDIEEGIRKTNFCVIPDRRGAIRKALELAKSGDIVLVAGKGHENYQVLKDKTLHFDDREVVRECLKSINY